MTDKDTLLAALTDATYAYDEAVAEGRDAAKKLADDFRLLAAVGESRRNAAALKRLDAYQAYLKARNNLDAGEANDDT